MVNEMTWPGIQIIVLAVALVTANSQCSAQCAIKPCHAIGTADESVAPCHRHKSPKPTHTQESCKYIALVSDYRALSLVSVDLQRFDFTANPTASQLPLVRYSNRTVYQTFPSLRIATNALFRVLRV